MTRYDEPQIWTKGDKVRSVETPADAVQAQWDGFSAPTKTEDTSAPEQDSDGDDAPGTETDSDGVGSTPSTIASSPSGGFFR